MKIIVVNGKPVESKDDNEILKNFSERWRAKIEEIKKLALDRNQAYQTINDFITESTLIMGNSLIKDKISILYQHAHDVKLAVRAAYSNFKKENKNFWSLLIGNLKLPDIKIGL